MACRSTVIDYLDHHWKTDKKVGLAYIYFIHSQQTEQTPESILGSLLKQLLQAQEGLPISKGLEDLYKKYFDEARPTFDQYSELLQFETRKHAKVFIVIDALDECTDDNREKLLRALQTLRVNVNFLFTSREHINIKREFPNAKELQVYARGADLQIWPTSTTLYG